MKSVSKIFFAYFLIVLLASVIFRSYVVIQLSSSFDFRSLLSSLFIGVFFDGVVALYTFIPFIILLLLYKDDNYKNWVQKSLYFVFFCSIAVNLFTICSEYFFYQEFKDRFNFIAVDYLVYSNEVLRNIWESYPIVPIMSFLLGMTILVFFLVFKYFRNSMQLSALSLSQKLRILIVYIFLFLSCLLFVNERSILDKLSAYEALLSKNGYHALFAAYRNNEISYDRFYTTMSSEMAEHEVHELLKGVDHVEKEIQSKSIDEDEKSIIRNLSSGQNPLRKNVIFVLMESMSARYMGLYGNNENLTPNLDRMAREGLFFSNIYSTGTRTVRGIEATLLSIPPTPGQSIVRRPEIKGLFNLGSVFKDHFYDCKFIYGGRSFFDNMGEFFSENDFDVIDQSSLTSQEIRFSNAWGVSDEDLFDKVIAESDQSYKNGRNFFNYALTTSNHRPYTYPQSIDIPSGSGRSGAVKYADYAVGELIKKAQNKPWFKDTVFVFVSDHNASVSGADIILPEDYHIPFIIYSPGFVAAEEKSFLASQIDVAPTLLGLLKFSYQSKFFGENLLSKNPERAFLGTYQKIGYIQNKKMTILAPNKKNEYYELVNDRWDLVKTEKNETIDQRADSSLFKTVAFYKTASDWFKNKRLQRSYKAVNDKNIKQVINEKK